MKKEWAWAALWGASLVGLAGCAARTPVSVQENPGFDRQAAAQAYATLGREYLVRGSWDLAQARLERALQLDETLASAHHDLAVVASELGHQETAEIHYRRALALSPDEVTLHYNYGTWLYNQGRNDEAEFQFRWVMAQPDRDGHHPQARQRLDLLAQRRGE